MRLAFMGTPDFAVPVLMALIEAGHDVVRVYSQPPRRAGRGKGLRQSPVHLAAEAAEIAKQSMLAVSVGVEYIFGVPDSGKRSERPT